MPCLARPRLPCVGICAKTYLCSALAACAPWPRCFSPFGCLSIGTVEFPAGQAQAWEMLCLLISLASFLHLLPSFLAIFCMCACVEARRRRRRMQRVAATPTLAVPAAQRRGETSVQCAVNCFMAVRQQQQQLLLALALALQLAWESATFTCRLRGNSYAMITRTANSIPHSLSVSLTHTHSV